MIAYLADRLAITDAANLIDRHGDQASATATALAGDAGKRGNAVRYCRWRQIARWIEWLDGIGETRH